MNEEDVLVIGAGPAGLAVSASLRRAGVPHVVVDRAADVGASWRTRYDRLHLHTVKSQSSLPFSPWPRGTDRYPSRDDMIRYLERYATEHRIAPRFGVDVRRVTRGPSRFRVDTSAGLLEPRYVVVATGYNSVPNRPELHGLAAFAGSVIHTERYRNPEPYVGKRTLVVGCGNSGAEIALDLAEHRVDVAMVVRGPAHVVPRDILGLASQRTAITLSRLPPAARDAVVAPILRLAVGDLSHWGIVRPPIGPNQTIVETGRIPMLDVGTIAQIKAGRIRVRPGVQEVLADRIRFVDGRVEAYDAIVLATGYRPDLGRFIDAFDRISDRRGLPPVGGGPAIPGLFFVGFRNPPTGALREIAIEALRLAELFHTLRVRQRSS